MKHNLFWMRLPDSTYQTKAYDSAMTRVPNAYAARKGQSSEGGGWLLNLNGEWHSIGATLTEVKTHAQRHHDLIVKYGTADQRSTNDLAASIKAELQDTLDAIKARNESTGGQATA